MLNRRIIRGKVLQQIFAFKTCVTANAEITTEKIIEKFSPDLNSIEPQDQKKLEVHAKLALLAFDGYLKTGYLEKEPTYPENVSAFVSEMVNFYDQSNQNDKERILKRMVIDAELISEHYLLLLKLLSDIAFHLSGFRKNSSLEQNTIIKRIDENSEISGAWAKGNLNWGGEQDIVGQVINILVTDEDFMTYSKMDMHPFEEDKKMLLHIIKTIVLKNPLVNEFFELKHINWQEDKVAVKDMLVDSIKDLSENGDFVPSPISKNWEDDKNFMKSLFEHAIENERDYDSLISPLLKNWDISRLTNTDSIILKMCISELINFPGIPVKVSINEYIEVSKRYSTPKSKTLINGVLDKLSIELVQNGTIKKSGRGLIDNK